MRDQNRFSGLDSPPARRRPDNASKSFLLKHPRDSFRSSPLPRQPCGESPCAPACQAWGIGSPAAPALRPSSPVEPRRSFSLALLRRVRPCEGMGRQGRAGLPQAGGQAGTKAGFPASAQLPKRHFSWQLEKKNPQSKSWFSLARFGRLLLRSCQAHSAASPELGLSRRLRSEGLGPGSGSMGSPQPQPRCAHSSHHPSPAAAPLRLHGRGAAAVPEPKAPKDATDSGIFAGFDHPKPQTRPSASEEEPPTTPLRKGRLVGPNCSLAARGPCTGLDPDRGAQGSICRCRSPGHGCGLLPCATTQSCSRPQRLLATMRQPALLKAGSFSGTKPLLNLQTSYIGHSSSGNKLLPWHKTPEDTSTGEFSEEETVSPSKCPNAHSGETPAQRDGVRESPCARVQTICTAKLHLQDGAQHCSKLQTCHGQWDRRGRGATGALSTGMAR